jgi:hypothetical protein
MALIDAENFEMMSSDTTQVRIDGDAVKELLERLLLAGVITEEEKAACFKEISFVTIKTNRKDKTKKPKFVPPNLGPNTTPERVVDMLGENREKKKDLEKEEGMLKDYLQAKVIKPEAEAAEKVQPVGIDDDGIPAWALDGKSTSE